MPRRLWTTRAGRAGAACLAIAAVLGCGGADDPDTTPAPPPPTAATPIEGDFDGDLGARAAVEAHPGPARAAARPAPERAAIDAPALPELDAALRLAGATWGRARAWYATTPPSDRATWGGLAAASLLGLIVMFERMARLKPRKIVPRDFDARFLERLEEGELDRGKALDFCELNPSPASRVALAAVRRWGRPTHELERAVATALKFEGDRMRRNVGTLRRVAALTPLIGLLGALIAAGRALAALPAGAALGPAFASALAPLTAGVAISILALVAYDGLIGRIEKLLGGLDRVAGETIDVVARYAVAPTASTPHSEPRAAEPPRSVPIYGATRVHERESLPPARRTPPPHQIRLDQPPGEPSSRRAERYFDFD